MTSPIETNNVVERSFIDHLRGKAAATDDIGDATDFAQAADELQSLSDRLDVLEVGKAKLKALARSRLKVINAVKDENEQLRASLTQGGNTSG